MHHRYSKLHSTVTLRYCQLFALQLKAHRFVINSREDEVNTTRRRYQQRAMWFHSRKKQTKQRATLKEPLEESLPEPEIPVRKKLDKNVQVIELILKESRDGRDLVRIATPKAHHEEFMKAQNVRQRRQQRTVRHEHQVQSENYYHNSSSDSENTSSEDEDEVVVPPRRRRFQY